MPMDLLGQALIRSPKEDMVLTGELQPWALYQSHSSYRTYQTWFDWRNAAVGPLPTLDRLIHPSHPKHYDHGADQTNPSQA